MKIQTISDVPVDRSRPFLILEAGVNHEGSLPTAFEMIDAAADAAQMIKFQSYKAKTLASRNSPSYWDRSKEPTATQYELFQKHDSFGDDDYRQLYERCAKKGILFLSTPFDSHFVHFLDHYMPVFKIASADITDLSPLASSGGKAKTRPAFRRRFHYLSRGRGGGSSSESQRSRRSGLASLRLGVSYRSGACQSEHDPIFGGRFSRFDHRLVRPRLARPWLPFIINGLDVGAEIWRNTIRSTRNCPESDHYHAMDPDDVRDFIRKQKYIVQMLGKYGKTVLPCEEDSAKVRAPRTWWLPATFLPARPLRLRC